MEYFIIAKDWLTTQYGNNDFLVGTTVPLLLASLAYFGRSSIASVYNFFLRCFTTTIRLNSTMREYDTLSNYIFKEYVWGVFKRDFVIDHVYTNDKPKLFMSAGYGRSIALVNGCIGYITREVEESDSYEFKEWLEIRVLSLRPSVLSTRIFEEFKNVIAKKERGDVVRVYRDAIHGVKEITQKPLRPLSTIFIPNSIKTTVMNHLKDFEQSEDYCIEKGVPWHTGLILHGPPGTGKTSFIHAIASELGRDIHYHSAGSFIGMELDARKSILVLEDFDAAALSSQVKDRTKKGDDNDKESSTYTLSDVLNFLDGFLTPHGLLVIASTNHLEKLDAALIRPGRFDLSVEIPNMEYTEYTDMCKFHDKVPVKEEDFKSKAGADLSVEVRNYEQT